MDIEQLALFGDDAVTGTGQLHPWPVADPEPEPETPAENPNQLAVDLNAAVDPAIEDAA
jgi:hypothetical protein